LTIRRRLFTHFHKFFVSFNDFFKLLISQNLSKQFYEFGSVTLFEIVSETDFNHITLIKKYLQKILFNNKSNLNKLIPLLIPTFISQFMNLTIKHSSINLSLLEICYFLHQTSNELYFPFYKFILTTLPKLNQIVFFQLFFKFIEKIPFNFPLLEQSFKTIFHCVFHKCSQEDPTIKSNLFSKFFTFLSHLIQTKSSYMKFILNFQTFLSFLKGLTSLSLTSDSIKSI
jgi:hypothetical protein